MTPSKQNWADRAVKALRVIDDARYYPTRDNKEQLCQNAYNEVKSAVEQILYNFRLKRTGAGLQKLFDELNKSLSKYRKYISDSQRSQILVDAYKDAYFAWRNLLKESKAATTS